MDEQKTTATAWGRTPGNIIAHYWTGSHAECGKKAPGLPVSSTGGKRCRACVRALKART